MNTSSYTAVDIANYFLLKAQIDDELISNLKIQKLVYYAQGLHLVINETPLFDEQIQAWEYGPVVSSLYHEYKKHGSNAIPAEESFDPDSIDTETKEFLDEVYSVLGQFSAIRLMDLTHEDQCWKDAWPNGIISLKAMQTDLKKYIKEDE